MMFDRIWFMFIVLFFGGPLGLAMVGRPAFGIY